MDNDWIEVNLPWIVIDESNKLRYRYDNNKCFQPLVKVGMLIEVKHISLDWVGGWSDGENHNTIKQYLIGNCDVTGMLGSEFKAIKDDDIILRYKIVMKNPTNLAENIINAFTESTKEDVKRHLLNGLTVCGIVDNKTVYISLENIEQYPLIKKHLGL